MKLKEILLKENHVEPNVMLSILNVLKAGKFTNLFEAISVTRMLQYLKMGILFSESNPLEVNITTCPILLNHLKSLSPIELLPIVKALYSLLEFKNNYVIKTLNCPDLEYKEWLDLLLASEALD